MRNLKKSILFKICLIIFVFIIFKLLVADLYYVPTESMENTIKRKSYIVVSKVQYGAILPKTTNEIPYTSKITKKIGSLSLWENSRFFGFSDIKRNDIILGEHDKIKIVKRVVGLPKDTIRIKNGFLKINSRYENILNSYKYKYKISMNKKTLDTIKHLTEDIIYTGDEKYEVTLDGKLLKLLKENKKVATPTDNKLKINDSIFPYNMIGKWDKNNYGSIVIPYKGLRVVLNQTNFNHYKDIIETYENHKIDYRDLKYFIDGLESQFYVFNQDYFFIMGDNRMNSLDSRYIGFLPKKKIFGKVTYWF